MAIVEQYRDIHQQLKEKYINEQLIQQETQNAKLLQDFLINVKRTLLGRTKQLTVIDELAFSTLMKQLEDNFKKVSRSNAKLENLLFHGTGQGFERDIAKLHQIAEKSLGLELEKQMDIKDINIGNISANILNTADTIHIANSIIQAVEKMGNETIDKIVGADFHKGMIKKGRSGKIDVRGNKDITIVYDLQNISNTIWQIIASSNFTLKNKKSLEWDKDNKQLALAKISNIHLGHTTPYVAIIGAISSVNNNLSLEEKEKIFYGGLEEGINNGVDEVNYHLNHLQFIYELSGAGQYYGNNLGNIGETEYFIYNDPDSDDIQVRSVRAMIAETLQENNKFYSRNVSFNRKNISKNKLTKQAKRSYNRYKH